MSDRKSSSHSLTSPSMMLAKYRSRATFHVSLQGTLIFSYQTRSRSDCTATIGRTTAWITMSRPLPASSRLIQSVPTAEPRFESGASRIRTLRSAVRYSKREVVDDYRFSCWLHPKIWFWARWTLQDARLCKSSVANLFTHISEKWLTWSQGWRSKIPKCKQTY